MRRQNLVISFFIVLFICFFKSPVEAEKIKSSCMQRVLVNGKVVLDTSYQDKINDLVRKNVGQTIVILPRSSYSGIWQQQKKCKDVNGKMLTVYVNGKAVLDSKSTDKIIKEVLKNRGKRIVVKQKDKPYLELSPQRVNVVFKGAYSKQVLEDSLKEVIEKTKFAYTKGFSNKKPVKEWKENGIIYAEYKGGGILSFSCETTKDPRVSVIHEMSKKDYLLNRDCILIQFGEAKLASIGFKRGNGNYTFTLKSGVNIYEVVVRIQK